MNDIRMDNSMPNDIRKRVLAVDDDPSIRHMLERVLSRTYDLVVAENGELALEEVRRRRPDLVLLDLRMPVMDGSELLERLEAEGIEVPVVLMTAEIRHGFLDSPLVRARHDKLLGVDALLETCARVLAGAPIGPA
jgi:CheY-like chemotaxis protein